jgi:hypothetical protein
MGNKFSISGIEARRANREQQKKYINELKENEREKMNLEVLAISRIDKICTDISSNLDEIKKSYALKFKKNNPDISRRRILNKDNNYYKNNTFVKELYDTKNNEEVYIYEFTLKVSLLKEVLQNNFDIDQILKFFINNIPKDPLKPEVSTKVSNQLVQVLDNIKLNETLKLLLLYLYNCHIIDIAYIYDDGAYYIYKDIDEEDQADFTKSDDNEYLTLAKVFNNILISPLYYHHNGDIKIILSNKEVPEDPEDLISKVKKQMKNLKSSGEQMEDLKSSDGGNNKNKPIIIVRKEILGKERCIYKKTGDRKEYVKYKSSLITVKDYKKIIKARNNKKI